VIVGSSSSVLLPFGLTDAFILIDVYSLTAWGPCDMY